MDYWSSREIYEECNSVDDARARERYWCEELNADLNKNKPIISDEELKEHIKQYQQTDKSKDYYKQYQQGEKYKQYQKEYRLKQGDKYKDYKKQYYLNNVEKYKQYYLNNVEKYKQYQQGEKYKEYQKEYQQGEKYKEYKQGDKYKNYQREYQKEYRLKQKLNKQEQQQSNPIYKIENLTVNYNTSVNWFIIYFISSLLKLINSSNSFNLKIYTSPYMLLIILFVILYWLIK